MSHRISRIAFVVLVSISFFFPPGFAAVDQGAREAFKNLSRQILQKFYEFDPVFATSLGVHDYDGKFMSLDRLSLEKNLKSFYAFKEKLDKINVKALSNDEAIDYKILKSEVVDRIKLFEELEFYKRNPSFYIIHGLYGIYLLKERYPDSPALSERLKAFPDLIDNALLNISKPYEVYLEIAKAVTRGALRYFEEAKFPEGVDYPKMTIINSVKAFYIFLMKIEDTDPTYPITKDYYLWKLRNFYFVENSVKSLERELEELITNTENEFKHYINNLPKTEFEPKYLPIDDVVPPPGYAISDYVDDYNILIGEVKDFLKERNFIEIPDVKADITSKVKPPFLQPILPGFGFEPPAPFDDSKEAYLYVQPSKEKFKEDNKFKTTLFRDLKSKIPYLSIVQVAYPGHFVQKLYAYSNPSEIRKIHTDLVFENGWSFYSEQLMYQKGLFLDHLKFSPIVINGKKYRAIRALAELKLCTGQLDFDGAVKFLSERMGTDEKGVFERMLRKSAVTPLNYLSYVIGKRQIDEIKLDRIKSLKDKFDEKKFHKELLASGSIPLIFKK